MAWVCWLGWTVAGWAQDGSPLAWLKQHPEAQPKQVALAEDTVFNIVLDGKPVGTTLVIAGTVVDLAAVGDATLMLNQAAGRAEVDPAKTDFGDRIRAARAARDKAAAADPAAALRLPADSLQAEWYAAQIREKFDPWLAAYPDSPLFAEVQARREAFAAEMSRVAAGNERHGERWIAVEELPEWRDDAAADALRLRLETAAKRRDATELPGLLAQVAPLAKAGSYPALVRAALAAVDAALPGMTPEGARAAVLAKKETLSADEDKLVADLRASVGEVFPTSPTPVEGWGGVCTDGLYRPSPPSGNMYVTAHHYAGLKEYYHDDDPHSYYPMLSNDELNRVEKEAADVQAIRTQKAGFDVQAQAAAAAAGGERDKVTQLQAKLVAEPVDRMEQALARLPDAASRLASGDVDGGLGVLKEVEAIWPGSEAVARWKLDQLAALLKDGKGAAAIPALAQGAPDWPRAVRLRAAAGTAAVAVAPAPAVAAPPDDGGTGKRHEASRIAWDQAVGAARQGKALDAWNAFREAREQWPENPSVSDAVFYAEVGGGVLALLFLIWLWRRLSDRD